MSQVPQNSNAVSISEIEATLWSIIDRSKCVLRFDASLIDDLSLILEENYGVKETADISRCRSLQLLISQLGLPQGASLQELPQRIAAVGIDKSKFRPVADATILETSAKVFDHWSLTTAESDVDAVVALQRDLGMGQYNVAAKRHDIEWPGGDLKGYLRGVTTIPASLFQRAIGRSYWELWITWWKLRGFLTSDIPSLSIGPRWITEIRFFREVLGLKRHVGLDLFSDDDGLVVSGDMHAMQFPDDHFQLVFIKNTIDKSYDFRRLVREILRVLRPGGIVVVDQIAGYGDCSPLTRTDIQHAKNLVRVFQANASEKLSVFVQKDIPLDRVGGARNDRAKFNARLAFRVGSASQ